MTGGRVPYPAEPIIAARHDHGPIPIEIDGRDGIGVSRQDSEALTRLDIPDADGLVEGARDEEVGVGVEVEAEGVVGVAPESGERGGRLEVPEAERLVVGGGGEEAAVGGEGDVRDAMVVPGETVKRGGGGGREGGSGVGEDGGVGGGGSEQMAVRGELNGGEGALVADEGLGEGIGFIGRGGFRGSHIERERERMWAGMAGGGGVWWPAGKKGFTVEECGGVDCGETEESGRDSLSSVTR